MRKALLPLLFCLTSVLSSTYVLAQMPPLISYQGVLVERDGTAVTDESYALTFKLYTSARDGIPVWEETQMVVTLDGFFDAILGLRTPLNSVSFNRQYWVALQLQGEQEWSPRIMLTSSPSAFYADSSGTAIRALRASVADSLNADFSGIVRSINQLQGAVQLVGSEGVTVQTIGDSIVIGGQGSLDGISEIISPDSSVMIMNPTGPVVSLSLPESLLPTSQIDTAGATEGQFLGFDGDSVLFLDLPSPPDPFELPYSAITSAGTALFSIVDTGQNGAGLFGIRNSQSEAYALHVFSNGNEVPLRVERTNTSGTTPAIFATTSSTSNGSGLSVGATGVQGEVLATSAGGWSAGVRGINNSTTGNGIGVVGLQNGSGWGVVGQTASGIGVRAVTGENGNALVAIYSGTNQSSKTSDNIAIFQAPPRTGGAAVNQARISSSGTGYFNGGTVSSGADVAELFDVTGLPSGYEPGDVLAIARDRDRALSLSSEPYSTLVVGVYATKPGVLLTEEHLDSLRQEMVPLGIIGVIPTKVTSDNGPILRGDILVTSSRPGHAMKGDPATAASLPGSVLGKALENFEGEGSGIIRVLVNVR